MHVSHDRNVRWPKSSSLNRAQDSWPLKFLAVACGSAGSQLKKLASGRNDIPKSGIGSHMHLLRMKRGLCNTWQSEKYDIDGTLLRSASRYPQTSADISRDMHRTSIDDSTRFCPRPYIHSFHCDRRVQSSFAQKHDKVSKPCICNRRITRK